ncbi:MAG: leucyl aminopeptidase [Acidobacteria bacterium]|uniref:Probable cytosol aminopeptidase n=1 Tax=Candidatus Polarisedimenticola svalbardensis TaxID=2886004 RepID=A0A8J6Y8Q4_9BACT|nr:leucyl aminopeptidase [Candidatus Polarisedimenticola svalbardensis]
MKIRTSGMDLAELKADVAACFAYEGDSRPAGVKNGPLARELAAEMKAETFKGNLGDIMSWNADGRFGSRRFLVIGLGKKGKGELDALRAGCAKAARAAAAIHCKTLALRLPPASGKQVVSAVRAAVEGAHFGAYHFDRYLTDVDRQPVHLVSALVSSNGSATAIRKAAALGSAMAASVCLARDLVNEPPSRLNPVAMAKVAVTEGRKSGLTVKVYNRAELVKLGFKSMLAVARGSKAAPKFVHLVYKPKHRTVKTERIVLVGKGVTFDSGGLNLKPAGGMLAMKCDMGGAAAVLGAMTALRDTGCKAEVHGLLGLVENMVNGDAYKPGDILDTYHGKTVEVGNTDAEGRLVMCDLLAYAAKKLKPTAMVDLATLTGACMVALGVLATGLFTRHAALEKALLQAAGDGGEKVWPLPMFEEYLDQLQSGPADLINIGQRWGGAITAALFLGEFLPRDLPWAHLDIAGPAFCEKATAETPLGGTGAGVRTIVRWLEGM